VKFLTGLGLWLCALALPAAAQLSDAALAPALEAAWQRSTERLELEDVLELTHLDGQLAERTWVQPPVLDGSYQHGDDRKEIETGLALPLWQSGQRSAEQATVAARLEWQRAALAAARLDLAGEVREAAWRVLLAHKQHEWQQEQMAFLQRLHADVQRRVQAGDLAEMDAARAQARHLQAQVEREQVWQAWQQALSDWQVLTGLDAPPPLPVSHAPEADISLPTPCHPAVCLAEWEITLAQRRSAAIDKERPNPPALLLRLRQEKGRELYAGNNDSVRVGISIPLGKDSKHTARRAAATLQIDDARAARDKLLTRLAAAQEVARRQWQSAGRQWQAAQARDALMQQQSDWLKAAFDVGQAALPDYLQALSEANTAHADMLRQQTALGLAHSRLLQVMGRMP